MVKFTKPELKKMMGNEKYSIKSVGCLKEILEEEELTKKDPKLNKDYHLQYAILLETRLAKNIPNYDYSRMKKDERILHFENNVERKLNISKKKIKKSN